MSERDINPIDILIKTFIHSLQTSLQGNMLFSTLKFAIQLFSFICSLFFNIILIYLILTKSPKKMGTYKYLLVYFCCFSMLYSILDIIVGPVNNNTYDYKKRKFFQVIHSHGSSFFMMMKLGILKNHPEVGFLLVCKFFSLNTYSYKNIIITALLCGCFAVSITTISIQFVFRYFAMER